MPNIPFSQIDDAVDSTPLPDGEYNCFLEKIEEKFTNSGDEMWRLRFTVLDGDHKDKHVFDNMVFSNAAYPRAKLICSRLGLDVSKDVALTQDMLIGRKVIIQVEKSQYQDKNGDWKDTNTIPFAGYTKYKEVKKKT